MPNLAYSLQFLTTSDGAELYKSRLSMAQNHWKNDSFRGRPQAVLLKGSHFDLFWLLTFAALGVVFRNVIAV